MPMAKYFAAVKKKPIITAKVFTAVPPSHTAKNPAMKNPRMPSLVSLSPPGSFSVDTLNTESAILEVSPDALAMTERPRPLVLTDPTEPHASAAACKAPVETAGLWVVAPVFNRARIATRAAGATLPVVLVFRAWREVLREAARDPTEGVVMALIA